MRPQINRLPAQTGKGLAGIHIDRTRPVRFTLNGRVVQGYKGDTVLSALLASGIDTLGEHQDQPFGLRAGATPAIAYLNAGNDPQHALPMDRMPARDGAEFRIVAGRSRRGFLARLFQPGRTLGLALDDHGKTLSRPWRALRGRLEAETDLVVIGGGVAGMSAALAGANAGLRVTLLEASPYLGGHSGLFGTQDGESTPEENVAALLAEIGASDRITVQTMAEAFAIGEGMVRVHRLDASGERVTGQVVDLPARFIIIATGALERLPVFPGNRLPGITGALEAYELAYRYGIWPGQSWLLATTSNPAYRLATLLAETDMVLDRILEGRDRASSRFIEFCKAYGIRQFPGTLPASATSPKSGGRLSISLPQGEVVSVERLVICGGWQPDLTLWHIAGGESRWNAQRQRLEPVGDLPSIALAGSAAGCFTRRGCVTSGMAAVDHLLGRAGRGVDDPLIDELYETPDGMPKPSVVEDAPPPSYLSTDETLLIRPRKPRPHWTDRLPGRRPPPVSVLSEAPQPLSIGAICAGVGLGLIPPQSAGVVAQERVALIPLTRANEAAPPTPADLPLVPAYLVDRFGPDARTVPLSHDPSRQVGSGALIFADEDRLDPRLAVGVVLRIAEGRTLALVAADIASAPRPLFIRDLGQTFPARIAQ